MRKVLLWVGINLSPGSQLIEYSVLFSENSIEETECFIQLGFKLAFSKQADILFNRDSYFDFLTVHGFPFRKLKPHSQAKTPVVNGD